MEAIVYVWFRACDILLSPFLMFHRLPGEFSVDKYIHSFSILYLSILLHYINPLYI
jgi:hypothetical protein